MAKRRSWYRVSFTGGLLTALYALMPPYILYVEYLGFLPPFARLSAGTSMAGLVGLLIFCRSTNRRIFERDPRHGHSARSAFTLIELLIVISIIGILSSLLVPTFLRARDAAYLSRAKAEIRSIAVALVMYTAAHDGAFPADVDRGLPPGLENYLAPGEWPKAPWPGSVYDWDNWAPGDLSYAPQEQVRQISIRFCPLGAPTQCTFPKETWAANFDYHSAFYYCIEGPCRSHASKPLTHPGFCVNC